MLLQEETWIAVTLLKFVHFYNRLKQELIKELVRSDKEANVMKKTFSDKVEQMGKEVERKKKDLEQTQKTLAQYEVKSHQEQHEKQKLELDYKKKLQTLEEQLHELQKRQKVSFLPL